MNNLHPIKIFSLHRNQKLAMEVVDYLSMELGKSNFIEHPNGEYLPYQNETVRGCDVFLIAHIEACKEHLHNDIIETSQMLYSLKSGEPHRVHLVLPYFPYSRQDRESDFRQPILTGWMIRLFTSTGADHITTLKIHNPATAGIPDPTKGQYMKNIDTAELFQDAIKDIFDLEKLVIVAPDASAGKDAIKFAKRMGVEGQVVICDKQRSKKGVVEKIIIIGDVAGKDCLVFDDMTDTAGTLVTVYDTLKKNGAGDVYAASTHAILSEPAIERISKRPFKKIWFTDSCIIQKDKMLPIFEVITSVKFIGKVIRNIHNHTSVTELMENGIHHKS